MAIYLTSRYASSVVDFVSFKSTTDAYPVVFYEFTSIGKISYSEHTWKIGDRLDQVSMHYYMDPERWWVIMEYNPEITDPQNIKPGTVLRIPRV